MSDLVVRHANLLLLLLVRGDYRCTQQLYVLTWPTVPLHTLTWHADQGCVSAVTVRAMKCWCSHLARRPHCALIETHIWAAHISISDSLSWIFTVSEQLWRAHPMLYLGVYIIEAWVLQKPEETRWDYSNTYKVPQSVHCWLAHAHHVRPCERRLICMCGIWRGELNEARQACVPVIKTEASWGRYWRIKEEKKTMGSQAKRET